MQPPIAERRPHRSTLHGIERTDDYFWLRDRLDPAVLAHLRAENEYTEATLAHLADLRSAVYEEIKAKVAEDDLSAPARQGEWWYGHRTEKGSQYPIFQRWRDTPEGAPTVLIDQNELAGENEFCAMGHLHLDESQNRLAYSVDFSGNETFEIRFLEIEGRRELDDRIEGASYGGAWSANCEHFFYTTLDAAHRPYRAWNHRLGTPQADDVLVYEETDRRFDLYLYESRDRSQVLIELASNATSELRYLPRADPAAEPVVLIERKHGVRYLAEPHHGRWLVVTDEQAPNGRLLELSEDGAKELIAHDPDNKIAGVFPFAGHVVVVGRKRGNPVLTVRPDTGLDAFDLAFSDDAYRLRVGENREYESKLLRIVYESHLTPRRIIDVDLDTGEQSLVKETAVPAGYDPGDYRTYRIWADAAGVRIPITVAHRRNTELPAPTLLYGYGAYESVLDPSFDPALFPLLDRGVVYATAHIRGGGEMGRLWHLNGRMESKANTFTDFITAGEHLIAEKISLRGHMAARGVSAGGLLMGAVTVMRPDLWAAILAEVPFVDVINSMLDATIPLTVAEWEEWGNPALADQYAYLSAYSPYDNTVPAAYPAVLATAGFNDPAVAYWEPAKWVAKLRTADHGLKTDSSENRPGGWAQWALGTL